MQRQTGRYGRQLDLVLEVVQYQFTFCSNFVSGFPQRTELFSTYAAWAMCRAGFDVVDMLHFSHSYPKGTRDLSHYNDRAFEPLMRLIEKLKVAPDEIYQDQEKTNLVRCTG